MGIILDVIVVVIFAYIVYKSYKRGLISSVMGLAKGIVSFIAAYSFADRVGEFFCEKFMSGAVSGNINQAIMSLSKTEEGVYNLSKLFSDMPDALSQILTRYGADTELLGQYTANLTAGTEENVATVADIIARPVALSLSTIIAFILIFVLVFVLLSVVTIFLNAVFKMPVLKSANKILGMFFGIAEGAIIVILLSSIFVALQGSLVSLDSNLGNIVDSSHIVKACSSIDLFGLLKENVIKDSIIASYFN